jgi:hypothetical protein
MQRRELLCRLPQRFLGTGSAVSAFPRRIQLTEKQSAIKRSLMTRSRFWLIMPSVDSTDPAEKAG